MQKKKMKDCQYGDGVMIIVQHLQNVKCEIQKSKMKVDNRVFRSSQKANVKDANVVFIMFKRKDSTTQPNVECMLEG